MTTQHNKKRLDECRRIERELRLKNAELQIEIEKSRTAENILRESCQILTLVGEISKDIVEQAKDLEIYPTLEKIGLRLSLHKIFLMRFSSTMERYVDWYSEEVHKTEIKESEKCDLVPLMNWVYEKKCYSGNVYNLPNFFNIICCPKPDEPCCLNCNVIMIPIIIENKPWGIMGYAKDTDSDAADLTKRAIKNLSNLLAILLKSKEETGHLSELIDKKLLLFKQELRILKG